VKLLQKLGSGEQPQLVYFLVTTVQLPNLTKGRDPASQQTVLPVFFGVYEYRPVLPFDVGTLGT
jgi:hypothetical protein